MFNKVILKILDEENWPYYVLGLAVSICLIVQNGWGYFFNYSSMLIGLFLPIFIFIDAFGYVKSLLFKQSLENGNWFLYALQVLLICIVFLFGLKDDQRSILLLIDGAVCLILFIVMFCLDLRKNT